MIIDCDSCEVRGRACSDCVVSFLTIPVRPGAAPAPVALGHAAEPARGAPLEMDEDQATAVANLAGGGLIPPLRLVQGRRAG